MMLLASPTPRPVPRPALAGPVPGVPVRRESRYREAHKEPNRVFLECCGRVLDLLKQFEGCDMSG